MVLTDARMIADRYALREVLGVGGMATVWRATDQVLGREVAVKTLSPQYAALPGFLARFEREARHAARLSHPRLVTVFDSGIADGTAFIVMELVRGQTLQQVLDQDGPLPPREAIMVAAAVCEALDVAHAAGLVHRDIKPANIALPDGEVKVLDFGIARADDPGGTRTPGVLGTAAYMSPEQACGGPAGPPSDLYSLGCVLFEMLTGAPPFSAGSAVGLAYRHVHDDPGPPSARRPGLAPRLDTVTARLLAKDPAARPASAAEARTLLLAALNRGGMTVPPSGEAASPATQGRRRASRAEITLATTLGAALAALAALAAVLLTGLPGHAAPSAGSRATGQSPAVRPSPSGLARSPGGHRAGEHGSREHGRYPGQHPGTTPSSAAAPCPHATPHVTPHATPRATLPPIAAAAAMFVGNLEAGVADGQVTQSAGQNLYNQLHQLLFSPPGQSAQQVRQHYAQLAQTYDQYVSQGHVTGRAARQLRLALRALATAVG